MSTLLASLREGDFQADWYFSIIVAAMLALVVTAGGFAAAGARRVWRTGDRGPAALIGLATGVALLFFLGLLLLAAIGLLRKSVVT